MYQVVLFILFIVWKASHLGETRWYLLLLVFGKSFIINLILHINIENEILQLKSSKLGDKVLFIIHTRNS